MQRVLLVGVSVVLLLILSGCQEKLEDNSRDRDLIKQTEEDIMDTWENTDDGTRKDIVKTIAVTTGELTTVTSLVVEWRGVNEGMTEEEIEGLRSMGHLVEEERYTVSVYDYRGTGSDISVQKSNY